MKRIAITGIVLSTLLVSCKNAKNEKGNDANQNKENITLQEEEEVDNLPNPSDISFIAALDEYQKGNYARAAEYIENSTIELREEEKFTEKTEGLLLDADIQKIRSLEDKVRTNKIENVDVLTHAMVNAEMLVAHDYMVYTNAVFLEDPVKGVYYFSKALQSLNNATDKLAGKSKEEAEEITEASKKLAEKMESGSKGLENELKAQTRKIEDFLKKHETDLL